MVVVLFVVFDLLVVVVFGVVSAASDAAETTSMLDIFTGDKSTIYTSEDNTIVAQTVKDTSFFKCNPLLLSIDCMYSFHQDAKFELDRPFLKYFRYQHIMTGLIRVKKFT
ncbi:hypothetical protein D3C81_1837680 [compost metagenome]